MLLNFTFLKKYTKIKLMNLNPYLFIISIWGIYFLNNIYLNYKMRRFWPPKKIKEILLIPFYAFIFILCLNIYSYLLFSPQVSPELGGFFKTIGILFCLAAIFLFIYAIYFEKSFPSCLTVEQGKSLSGIYNYIRHPSYLVFFLITFGTAFYLDDILLFVLACLNHICLYFYYGIEEKQFVKKFPQYREYLKKTRRFLPTFSKKKKNV